MCVCTSHVLCNQVFPVSKVLKKLREADPDASVLEVRVHVLSYLFVGFILGRFLYLWTYLSYVYPRLLWSIFFCIYKKLDSGS